ncbi:MAG TPA: metalloregulator ArsR/SmtB family transcription factor [Candidatus Krumholzibacteriaceae bacterium]|nr:metalloregulator ArsR/SmtB family transcription factor [Candidatus Krumholzibacteriaceae bacterium]
MRDFLEITKALSDINRVRVLMALMNQELCVCQITELLKLASSTVSKHMSILDHARLVESRKEGRWVYYRLASNEENRFITDILELIKRTIRKDPIVQRDQKDLREILKKGCAAQNTNPGNKRIEDV